MIKNNFQMTKNDLNNFIITSKHVIIYVCMLMLMGEMVQFFVNILSQGNNFSNGV